VLVLLNLSGERWRFGDTRKRDSLRIFYIVLELFYFIEIIAAWRKGNRFK